MIRPTIDQNKKRLTHSTKITLGAGLSETSELRWKPTHRFEIDLLWVTLSDTWALLERVRAVTIVAILREEETRFNPILSNNATSSARRLTAFSAASNDERNV